MTHIQRMQLRALARRQEVAALKLGELVAAQAGVTEHAYDRQITPARQRVVGEPRLGLTDQPFVLRRGERLRNRALGALRACEPHRQRFADLRGRHAKAQAAWPRTDLGGTVLRVDLEQRHQLATRPRRPARRIVHRSIASRWRSISLHAARAHGRGHAPATRQERRNESSALGRPSPLTAGAQLARTVVAQLDRLAAQAMIVGMVVMR
ncbi:MAG: hypothetical protein ACR2L8_17420 [Solirubrobacteraceae bacterium]